MKILKRFSILFLVAGVFMTILVLSGCVLPPIPTVPLAPTLTATNTTANSVTLSWSETSKVTGFNILEATDGGTFTNVTSVGPYVNNYVVTGLTSNTKYYFEVAAYNTKGQTISNVATVETLIGLPLAPTLTATNITSNGVALSWSETSKVTGFNILESTNGASFTTITSVGPYVNNYMVSGLNTNTKYYFEVAAYNTNGQSISNTVNIQTLVGLPSTPNLKITNIATNSVTLSWNKLSASGFNVFESTNGTNFTIITSVGPYVNNYMVSELNTNTKYYFEVAAYNANGQVMSDISSPVTLPLAPTLTAASPTTNSVKLSWNNVSANGFCVYQITNGTNSVTTLRSTATTYLATGLSSYVSYTFKVAAYNVSGQSTSNAVNIQTLPTSPSTPILKATASATNSIKLSWNSVSQNYSLNIYQATNTTNFTTIAASESNITTYTATNLTPNTKYYFKIYTYNISGKSMSNIASTTTYPTKPSSPSLNITNIGTSSVKLSWTSVSTASGFYIYEATNTTNFASISSVGSNITTYTATNLTSNIKYHFEVVSYNISGKSTSSIVSTITLPSVPNLKVTTFTTNSIGLSWNPISADGFNIYKTTSTSTDFTFVTNIESNINTTAVTNLTPDSTYSFKVVSYNISGQSTSNIVTKQTLPLAPTLSATTPTVSATNSIALSWIKNSSANGFYIYKATNTTTSFATITSVGSNITTYLATGLNTNTKYYFEVAAYNNSGKSTSNTASAATTK